MSNVRALVLRTAGTNCDGETAFALERSGAAVDLAHVNRVADRPRVLLDYQILALPGGFSYGDDVAAGKIFANELRHRVGGVLADFVNAGRLVIGICNGFQVMVKMGLLPGPFTPATPQQVTLSNNDSGKFEDRWIHLKTSSKKCVFTQGVERVYLPIAHGEGKFLTRDESILKTLDANDQIVFRYVDASQKPAGYPHNPNGSQKDIAGICDPTGRVLGLMPHPERHFLPTQHPRWTRDGLCSEGDGAAIFRNAVNYFR